MSTTMDTSRLEEARAAEPERAHDRLRYLVPVARFLYVAIFLTAVPTHFTRAMIDAAARQGVPLAALAVPVAGIIAAVGAVSVLFGVRARAGAWLLVVFLVPVTLFMHAFWAAPDMMAAAVQRIMFLKNLSMLGGALLITHFGAGPVSFDARQHRPEP
jgi:putative oxidoreductase